MAPLREKPEAILKINSPDRLKRTVCHIAAMNGLAPILIGLQNGSWISEVAELF